MTAAYIWLKAIAAFLGWYLVLAQNETNLLNRLIAFLSSIGFAPVNPAFLSVVLKVGWLMLITGFSFVELGFFLFIYVLTLPGWAPIYLIFNRFTDDYEIVGATTENGSGKRKNWRLVFPAVTTLFIAWFLLYGNATTRVQLTPGVVLSGLFFLTLLYRLLLKTTPDGKTEVPILHWLTILISQSIDQTHQRVKKTYKKKSDVQSDQRTNRFTRKMLIKLTRSMKDPSKQGMVSLYILGEYIGSLVVVGASAILFWTILIKAAVAPELSLITSFQISAFHFLPGIQFPNSQIQLPFWSRIGPSATAWVLFVLYLGPASALLPEKQRATIKQVKELVDLYRESLQTLRKEKLRLRRELNLVEG